MRRLGIDTAFAFDAASMHNHNLSGDGQSQARAGGLPVDGNVGWVRKTTEPSELSRKESSISLPRKAGPKSCTTRFTIYPTETSHLLIPSVALKVERQRSSFT